MSIEHWHVMSQLDPGQRCEYKFGFKKKYLRTFTLNSKPRENSNDYCRTSIQLTPTLPESNPSPSLLLLTPPHDSRVIFYWAQDTYTLGMASHSRGAPKYATGKDSGGNVVIRSKAAVSRN